MSELDQSPGSDFCIDTTSYHECTSDFPDRHDANPTFHDLVDPIAFSRRLSSELPARRSRTGDLRPPSSDLAERRHRVEQMRRLIGWAAVAIILAVAMTAAA